MKPEYRCWAEIDLEALRQNLGWIRSQVGPNVKILTVVKADAYGHGLKQIATLLMQSGTDIFGVANLTEAHNIRLIGRGWPILMLGACLPNEVELAIKENVMPTISSYTEAETFSTAAMRNRKQIPIHVKVDTGMGRLGLPISDALRIIQEIIKLPGLQLEGLYTHYSSAEDDEPFTKTQSKAFKELVQCLLSQNIKIPYIHANNSAGVILEPDTYYNLVRPGLLVYGIIPPGSRTKKLFLQKHLKPVMSFKCRVGLVKEVPKGTPISYGHKYICDSSKKLAVITAGYGDGYMRAGFGKAHVLIRGERCPVLGTITMDQMIVDVSHINEVKPGDEVVLFGSQDKESITVNEVAQWFNTIPWEVFTAITYRVPRIYHGSQAS
jgi:alanine racemase